MSSQVSPHSHSTMEIFFSCDNEEMQKTSPSLWQVCNYPAAGGMFVQLSCQSRRELQQTACPPWDEHSWGNYPTPCPAWGCCTGRPRVYCTTHGRRWKTGMGKPKKKPQPLPVPKKGLSGENGALGAAVLCQREGVPDVSSRAKNAVG